MLPPPRQPSNRDIMHALEKFEERMEGRVGKFEERMVLKFGQLEGRVDAKLQAQDKVILSWKTKAWATAAGLGPLAVAGLAKATEWLAKD